MRPHRHGAQCNHDQGVKESPAKVSVPESAIIAGRLLVACQRRKDGISSSSTTQRCTRGSRCSLQPSASEHSDCVGVGAKEGTEGGREGLREGIS